MRGRGDGHRGADGLGAGLGGGLGDSHPWGGTGEDDPFDSLVFPAGEDIIVGEKRRRDDHDLDHDLDHELDHDHDHDCDHSAENGTLALPHVSGSTGTKRGEYLASVAAPEHQLQHAPLPPSFHRQTSSVVPANPHSFEQRFEQQQAALNTEMQAQIQRSKKTRSQLKKLGITMETLEDKEQVDLRELIEKSAQCSLLDEIEQLLEDTWPAAKGNNLGVQGLKTVYRSFDLGLYSTRKMAFPGMAMMLWLLAGLAGEEAAWESASAIKGAKLTPGLEALVGRRGRATMSGREVMDKWFRPVLVGVGGGQGGGQGGQRCAGSGASGAAGPSRRAGASVPASAMAQHPQYEQYPQHQNQQHRPELRQQLVEKYSEEFVQLASIGRLVMDVKQGDKVTWSKLFKTEFLANQPISFVHKKTGVNVLATFNHNGSGIICQCPSCDAAPTVWAMNHKEFLRHIGSKSTEILECVTLVSYHFTLKQLAELMMSGKLASATPITDIYPSYCHHCRLGGELLCCDGCTTAWHCECVGLSSMPAEDKPWLCPLCVQDGRALKSPESLENTRHMQRIVREKNDRRGKRGRKPGTGYTKKDFNSYTKGGGNHGGGRMRLMAPERGGRVKRDLNRNKRLFEGEVGGLQNGMRVHYRARSVNVLGGTIVINPSGSSGILCDCCNKIVSCSQFEVHSGHQQRRQPYEHIWVEEEGLNLKRMAARLPDLPEGMYGDEGHLGPRDAYTELDVVPTGCTFCHEPHFQREFGPGTIMICEQCMREFHVGCLEDNGLAKLDSLPEGDWFCDEQCGRIHGHLKGLVKRGKMDVGVLTMTDTMAMGTFNVPCFGESAGVNGAEEDAGIRRRQRVPSPYKLDLNNYSFHVLNGSDGSPETDAAIFAATRLLQESFDPIMDLASDTDLLPLMISARQVGDWDYSGMYTLLLKYCDAPVVAAVVRVFGPQMAELPLIATSKSQRRRGHAKVLVDLFQKHLSIAGVHKLALPAAHETVSAWKSGFHFHDMPPEQVKLAKQQLHLLVFPGTEMLWRDISGPHPALDSTSHHVLRPVVSDEDKLEIMVTMRGMVSRVVDAENEGIDL